MAFSSIADRDRVESRPYETQDVPATIYRTLTRTKDRFPARPALSFQLLSDPHSRSCTLTWNELHERVTETANLFRDLGVGPGPLQLARGGQPEEPGADDEGARRRGQVSPLPCRCS